MGHGTSLTPKKKEKREKTYRKNLSRLHLFRAERKKRKCVETRTKIRTE